MISERLCKSMSCLWIFIWKWSQVLESFPQEVFLIVNLRVLVGIGTGTFTLRIFSIAPPIKSAHTFSKDYRLQLVKGIHIRRIATSGSTVVFLISLKTMAVAWLPNQLVPWTEQKAVVNQEQVRQNPALLQLRPCLPQKALKEFLRKQDLVDTSSCPTHIYFSFFTWANYIQISTLFPHSPRDLGEADLIS